MPTLAYLRVSTDDQSLGLDAQRQAIQSYCNAKNLMISAWYTDEGVSGATMPEDRPGLSKCLADLRRGDTLIAAKRDRLARDLLAIALIERAVTRVRASLHTADGTSDSSLLAGVLDAVARHERQVIAQRTRDALRAKKARGEAIGHPPYGWALDASRTRLVPSEGEQAVLAVIASLRAAGKGRRAIASELARLGLRTRRGTAWTPTRVAQVLASVP